MMTKSKTIFNFKDINQSLYQLYLKAFGNKSADSDVA